MATGVFYKLADSNSNELIYMPKSWDETLSRMIWENEIQYIKDKWIQDQIATTAEIAINGTIKVGTARPYSTVKSGFAALRAMVGSSQNTGGTLRGGDWNGSTWTYNSDYPELGDGDTKILQSTIRFGHNSQSVGFGEGGEIDITINLKLGLVF